MSGLTADLPNQYGILGFEMSIDIGAVFAGPFSDNVKAREK
jgi:hypothetical protein